MLPSVWQKWLAMIALVSTLAGVGVFIGTHHNEWAWLAIAGLASLVVAVGWTAHDEHRARLLAEERHAGTLPQPAPRDGLVNGLREQVRARNQWAIENAHKENERQRRVVSRFAKSYVEQHPDADPGIASGTVPIPRDWLNEQLCAAGENWTPDSYLADPE